MPAGYQLTQGQMDAIREVVRRVMSQHGGTGGHRPRQQEQGALRIVIIGDMAGPASSDVDPAEGVGGVLIRDPSTNLLTVTTARIDILNYSAGLTAADGTYGIVNWIAGCWELVWVDCAANDEWVGLS